MRSAGKIKLVSKYLVVAATSETVIQYCLATRKRAGSRKIVDLASHALICEQAASRGLLARQHT